MPSEGVNPSFQVTDPVFHTCFRSIQHAAAYGFTTFVLQIKQEIALVVRFSLNAVFGIPFWPQLIHRLFNFGLAP